MLVRKIIVMKKHNFTREFFKNCFQGECRYVVRIKLVESYNYLHILLH